MSARPRVERGARRGGPPARLKQRKARRPRYEQLTLNRCQPGYREGAGRPKEKGSGVPHLRRAPLASRFPVHVTVRIRGDLPSLRHKRTYADLRKAFAAGCDKGTFRLNHFSVQTTHVHMVVEAADRERLSRGLQGLLIRMARALNRRWKRKGKVFADRYHDRILRTPREVRNVLGYVLGNRHHHGCLGDRDTLDPYSSSAWFDGWRQRVDPPDPRGPTPVVPPHTWLQRVGWRRHGLLDPRSG